jgi:two-component system, NarL family, nitrate/nitrite response regulator NarL
MPFRILIVDDNAEMRKGVHRLIERREDWEVCGEAADGLEGVAQVAALSPDLVVLDLSMPKLNGFEAAHAINIAAPQLPLLLFTQHAISAEMEQLARDSGFRGIVSKDSADSLISQIESLLQGKAASTSPLFSG